MDRFPLNLRYVLLYYSLPWLLLCNFLTPISSVSATASTATWFYNKVPRLSAHPRSSRGIFNSVGARASSATSTQFKMFYYKQTLDHFNYRPESYTTFRQRYAMDFRYWGGANTSAPIFAFLGAESPMDGDLDGIGFLHDNAYEFKALIVFIEHRYYGKSIPFGSVEEAYRNASTMGYFNSAQALADYAEVILHIKKKLSAETSPVIVFGGSYGGMLASWFRLKYPHVAQGALASSAPILYFEDIVPHDGYYSIVSKDFRDVSKSCHDTIRSSWSVIDQIASKPNGLSQLSRKFKTCSPLNASWELKNYLNYMYAEAAQYNRGPNYSVNAICDAIDGATSNQTDILGTIHAGVVARIGQRSCYNMFYFYDPAQKINGWSWQTCTDLVLPLDHGINATMFQLSTYDSDADSTYCRSMYGVNPRPHWIVTEFGGHDIKLVLEKFGSNIIFSNGLRDPYSIGGVLQNISDSIVALTTSDGSHCLDIAIASSNDPAWLIKQREDEVNIIKGWIMDYNAMRHTGSV